MKCIDELRQKLARRVAPPAVRERFSARGTIRIRRTPFTREEWAYWWLPERNEAGTIIRAARLSEKEKERYTVDASSNMVTDAGINLILSYIGSRTGSTTGFAKYLGLGSGSLTEVKSGDTNLDGEFLRIALQASSISGVQINVSAFHLDGVSPVVFTNGGIWGGSATAILGTGTLCTHAALKYTQRAKPDPTKDTGTTFDYLFTYA